MFDGCLRGGWVWLGVVVSGLSAGMAQERAEGKAIQFLSREVPSWRGENGCFSCHNNGDGARVLFMAGRAGFELPEGLKETEEWLRRPAGWKENKGDPGVSDPMLANIQFAGALAELARSGEELRGSMGAAGDLLLKDQGESGGWEIEELNAAGSPTTYGTVLATAMALRSLSMVEGAAARDGVKRARAWLMEQRTRTVPIAAGIVLGLGGAEVAGAEKKVEEAVDYLKKAQGSGGGWGPYPNSPAEAYDTAVALLALKEAGAEGEWIARGRRWLIGQQEEDGSWPATTRPSGGRSYAQKVSTTAWALMALLASRE